MENDKLRQQLVESERRKPLAISKGIDLPWRSCEKQYTSYAELGTRPVTCTYPDSSAPRSMENPESAIDAVDTIVVFCIKAAHVSTPGDARLAARETELDSMESAARETMVGYRNFALYAISR